MNTKNYQNLNNTTMELNDKIAKIFSECITEILQNNDAQYGCDNSILFFLCGEEKEGSGELKTLPYVQYSVEKDGKISTNSVIIDKLSSECDLDEILKRNLSFAEKCMMNAMNINVEDKLNEGIINFFKSYNQTPFCIDNKLKIGDFLLMFRRSEKYGVVVKPFFVQTKDRQDEKELERLNTEAKKIKITDFVQKAMEGII